MGSNSGEDNGKPIHKVKLNSFYIGKYEVTQKEYNEIMGNDSYSFLRKFKGDNLPVETVNIIDGAIKYCNEKSKIEGLPVAYTKYSELIDIYGIKTTDTTKVKGYRLPTEAEWEFAAKGGNKSKGYTYSGSNNPNEVGWNYENSDKKTHKVGLKKPNELGIYDMSGNVSEWCTDRWDKDFYSKSPSNNPYNMASSEYKSVRGGSWDDLEDGFNVSTRGRWSVFTSNSNIGFRIARTP